MNDPLNEYGPVTGPDPVLEALVEELSGSAGCDTTAPSQRLERFDRQMSYILKEAGVRSDLFETADEAEEKADEAKEKAEHYRELARSWSEVRNQWDAVVTAKEAVIEALKALEREIEDAETEQDDAENEED